MTPNETTAETLDTILCELLEQDLLAAHLTAPRAVTPAAALAFEAEAIHVSTLQARIIARGQQTGFHTPAAKRVAA